jgi:hypothetical protein
MRRPLAWLLGAFAAVLLRRRRRAATATAERVVEPEPAPDPRAEELRQKLAEAREVVEERDEFEAAETPVDQAEVASDPESRRRAVHESARSLAEEMRER